MLLMLKNKFQFFAGYVISFCLQLNHMITPTPISLFSYFTGLYKKKNIIASFLKTYNTPTTL